MVRREAVSGAFGRVLCWLDILGDAWVDPVAGAVGPVFFFPDGDDFFDGVDLVVAPCHGGASAPSVPAELLTQDPSLRPASAFDNLPGPTAVGSAA